MTDGDEAVLAALLREHVQAMENWRAYVNHTLEITVSKILEQDQALREALALMQAPRTIVHFPTKPLWSLCGVLSGIFVLLLSMVLR